MQSYRIFQGRTTRQIEGHLGAPADPKGWYYEPFDYEGDVLWSQSYATDDAARVAADEEENNEVLEEPPANWDEDVDHTAGLKDIGEIER